MIDAIATTLLSVAGGHGTRDGRRYRPFGWFRAMDEEHTTAAVQRCLDALAGEMSAEPLVRALLGKRPAAERRECQALWAALTPSLRVQAPR